jgi:putative phosphonate metabolism protein
MTISMEGQGRQAARYAIYWVPETGSALAKIGEHWLGREAGTDRLLPRQKFHGFDDRELAAITAEPRRYGLHATLKPPFRLATEVTPLMLETAVSAFAQQHTAFQVPSLRVARIGDFIALIPTTHCSAIDALAASCVEHFDRFRASLNAEELARRLRKRLTKRQEGNVRRWGYPHVMNDFRFHVTVTGPIAAAAAERLLPSLQRLFAPATTKPLAIAEIALFVQRTPESSFRLTRRFALRLRSEKSANCLR